MECVRKGEAERRTERQFIYVYNVCAREAFMNESFVWHFDGMCDRLFAIAADSFSPSTRRQKRDPRMSRVLGPPAALGTATEGSQKEHIHHRGKKGKEVERPPGRYLSSPMVTRRTERRGVCPSLSSFWYVLRAAHTDGAFVTSNYPPRSPCTGTGQLQSSRLHRGGGFYFPILSRGEGRSRRSVIPRVRVLCRTIHKIDDRTHASRH